MTKEEVFAKVLPLMTDATLHREVLECVYRTGISDGLEEARRMIAPQTTLPNGAVPEGVEPK